MTTSTASPAARTALASLIDYAGLFPPAALEMSQARAEYAAARADAHAWMLGRFIVPASRLDELVAPVEDSLSVILDADRDPRAWFRSAQHILDDLAVRRRDGGLRIETLEVPLPGLATLRETYDALVAQLGALLDRAGLRNAPTYVEIPRDERWYAHLPGFMLALARARLCAKLRCGGTEASAFPSVDEVATFVRAAREANVPFKATAGLHHPIRHRDAGLDVQMHGFVNLLAAAALAPRADDATLRGVLAEESAGAFTFEPESLRWRDEAISRDELAFARTHAFVAYGSCRFDQPVDDMIAFGAVAA